MIIRILILISIILIVGHFDYQDALLTESLIARHNRAIEQY